ncbi:MAG: carboxypeptidase regulatory-like domain-containing protein [Terracidiphilus sp.]
MGYGKTAFRWTCRITMLSVLCALSPALLSTRASAQGIITGSIAGSITDQTGAVIPGATITAVNTATQTTLQGKSTGMGDFFISNVPIGTYSLAIEASGFGKSSLSNVHVAAGNTTSVGRQILAPNGTAETVQVEAGAAELMNTETAQGETVISSEQLQTMPINGAMDDTTLLVPGVVDTHADGMSNTNGVNFSANGQRGRANNFEIDGQSNNDNSIAGPSFFFSNQDAISEIEVISNNFGAQYGRNMGTVVNYVTKTGTNSFHGTGFELYTGSWLSSLTQGEKDSQFGFCPSEGPSASCYPNVPRYNQNNWGGTLGGPILKDKLFFFGSTYWSHSYQGALLFSSAPNVFPDATGLKELQADFPNSPGVAALVNQGPYAISAGNPVPFGATSTLPVTDGSTIQNIEVSQFDRTLPNYTLDQEHLGRIDYQMTNKDRFFLRYNYQNNPTVPGAGSFASGGFVNVTGITHEVGGDWTHMFTPSVTNQARYSFQQSTIAFEAGGVSSCTIANFTSCPSQVGLGAGLEGFGYASNLPQGRVIKVNQIQDNASWTHGRQTIQFGGEFDHQDSPNVFLPNSGGAFSFAPGAANIAFRNVSSNPALNNGLTGLLQGITETELASGNTGVPFREPDFALYFQDDWKVHSNLTLNLGLRYEFFGQSVNLLHDESFAQQTGSHPFWSTALPLSATTFPYVNPYYKNIEPRIGFAYTPDAVRKMVVHGGFTMGVDPEFYNIFLNIATNAPITNEGAFGCDGVTINCVPSGGLTFGTVQPADTKFIPTGGDPRANPYINVPTNFHNPMAENYTLGIQYQVFPAAVMEVRYVGNHTFGQFQALDGNPELATVQAFYPGYGSGLTACSDPTAFGYGRENCSYGLIDTTANSAFSIYNGLQTAFTVRNFHNWTGTASYTFSRTIDNTSEIFSTGSGGNTSAYAQDPLNSDVGERGVSGNSYPNVIGLQMSYLEPWFKDQRGILGRALGGYNFNAFYTFNNGQPFNPIQNQVSVQSPNVLTYICTVNNCNAKTPPPPTINVTEAETSFCDLGFAEVFGNPCRPILSNPAAPMTSVGINTGPGGYINYVTGTPTSPSAVHWLWNNQYEALARHNPFPGAGRNILRGDSFNNLDLAVGKNFKIAEHVTMMLSANAFNALNRGYYGTPDPNIEDTLYPALYGVPNSFLSNYYSGGGGESPASGGAFGQGPGNRTIQLGGKVIF